MKHITSRITISPGRLSIFDNDGSTLIFHTYAESYCDEKDEIETGCSGGPPVACGIIAKVKDQP